MLASLSAQKSMTVHSETTNYAGSSSVQRLTLHHYTAFIPAKSMQSVLFWREQGLPWKELQKHCLHNQKQILPPFPSFLQQIASLRMPACPCLMANSNKTTRAGILEQKWRPVSVLLQWVSSDFSKRAEDTTVITWGLSGGGSQKLTLRWLEVVQESGFLIYVTPMWRGPQPQFLFQPEWG